MAVGTVKWFNRKIGAGFIRTDDGDNVVFLGGAIQDDPVRLFKGTRVRLDILKTESGLQGINVKVSGDCSVSISADDSH